MVATKIYISPNPDPSSKPRQNYLGQKCNSEFHACLLQWLPRPKDFSAATKSTVSAIKSITRHSPHNNTQHNTHTQQNSGPKRRGCEPAFCYGVCTSDEWFVRGRGTCDHNPKNVVKIPKTLHVWSTFHMRFVLKGVVGHYLKVTGDTRSPAKRISGSVPLCCARPDQAYTGKKSTKL